MKKPMLTPPDRRRCQVTISSYRPMVMGGSTRNEERCAEKPVVILRETVSSDGVLGAMSVCTKCLGVFIDKMPRKTQWLIERAK